MSFAKWWGNIREISWMMWLQNQALCYTCVLRQILSLTIELISKNDPRARRVLTLEQQDWYLFDAQYHCEQRFSNHCFYYPFIDNNIIFNSVRRMFFVQLFVADLCLRVVVFTRDIIWSCHSVDASPLWAVLKEFIQIFVKIQTVVCKDDQFPSYVISRCANYF